MSDQLSLFGVRVEDAAAAPAQDHDRRAREFAVDPTQNVVLEASAGTGKTTVLVARYVNLLARGADPANILAITFTRKAAAEMRERIVRELRRAADQSVFDRGRWTAIRDRLADIQISTIDAFCLALLREFPLEAGVDPGFEMADETQVPALVEVALDRSLRTFMSMTKREPDFALVLAQLGITRTREGLAHLLERRLVAWDALDRFLARGPSTLAAHDVCAGTVRRLADLLAGIPGGAAAFLDSGPVRHPRFEMLARDLRRLAEFERADDAAVRGLVDRVAAHFLTGTGKPRTSDRSLYPYCAEHYPNAGAARSHRAAVVALSQAVYDLVRAFARDLNVILARGIRRMFSIAEAEYRKALNERSVLDFSDLLKRAVELLRRMDEFSQSRFLLENRYHHVLVDEFQDTSRAQWELVSLLVEAWGEGLGTAGDTSIFIVGDRKQSIYRFRDADVALLQEAARYIDGLHPGGGARRSIARSFRAVPELLAFINEVCAELATTASRPDDFCYDETDRFPVEADVPRRRGFALGVQASPDPAVCAAAVAAEIARVLREDSVRDRQTGVPRVARPGDIAILFRSRASHREYERELELRGIPTYVYKGLGFFDADEIKDVSALIRFLAKPSSDLRAAAFLRSRFARISDRGLAALAPRLAAALTDVDPPAALDALADDDRAVLAHARPEVTRWIADVDRVPPADLLERILAESAYAYEVRGPRRQQAWENLKKMRALVRRVQNRGYATLARIADHLDSLSAGDESNAVLEALDAVNLMTVHAAKGLEFPIVFVVNLAKGASGPPRPVRLGVDGISVGPFVSEDDEEERAREREETKRLLYVALTRARDRLYLSTVLNKDGAFAPGRGSLGEVLPDSLRAALADACQAAARETSLTWHGASGASFALRVCRAEENQQIGGR
jgi:ATP-dependent exoDNAse (exonuclease V) beta subunit